MFLAVCLRGIKVSRLALFAVRIRVTKPFTLFRPTMVVTVMTTVFSSVKKNRKKLAVIIFYRFEKFEHISISMSMLTMSSSPRSLFGLTLRDR